MNELTQHSGPLLAIAAMVVNFVWSYLNLRLMRSMEKKFVTKELFHAEQRVQNVKHADLVRRLGNLEGAR